MKPVEPVKATPNKTTPVQEAVDARTSPVKDSVVEHRKTHALPAGVYFPITDDIVIWQL